MKKYVAIMALMTFAGIASAQSVSVSFQTQKNDNATQGHVMNYSLSQNVVNHLSADLTINNFQSDSNHAIFDRTEIGLTPSYTFKKLLTVGARVSVGEVQTSNHGNWSTYTVEPKVSVVLPYGLDVNAGYRRRSGFEKADLDTSNTTNASVGYAVTAKDRVSVGVSRLTGNNGGTANNPNKTYALTYTRSF
jgi:hypothetical protein